jgi:thiamine-phosphate pyrophosphorylase
MLILEAGEGAAERLAAVLAVVPVVSVIVRAPAGRPLTAAVAAPLVQLGQKAGAAMLIEADAELARALRADGVHLPVADDPAAAYDAARAWLGGRAIVGADAGRSRHDAMTLGERGADYVAFGIPAFVKGRAEAAERRLDLVQWWAEIFEVPVVAVDVEGLEAAGELTRAGADFVALTLACGSSPGDAAAEAHAFAAALAEAALPGTDG